MKERLVRWIGQHPVAAFYVLAFAITWLGWLPQMAYSRGWFPFDSILFYILGGTGPLLALFIVLRVLRGEAALSALFAPLFRWRVGAGWYAVALFGYVAIVLATAAISGDFRAATGKMAPGIGMLSTFAIAFVAAIPEELGWRGFALPRLQSRYSALVAALIVGVLWFLWHLPLLFTEGNVMATYPLTPFFVAVLGRSVIYTWLYNGTRGSVLLATLFHAVSNTVGAFVPLEAVITLLVAAVLVTVFGPSRLSRSEERTGTVVAV